MAGSAVGSFFVLDVGHGSCGVIVQGSQAVVIDAGPGAALLQFLQQKSVDHVESVIISHADADHLRGLVGLLAAQEVSIGHVYLNSDGVKGSDLWLDFAYELDELAQAGSVLPTIGLVRGADVSCTLAGWQLQVVAPRSRLVQLGVGNHDRDGQAITTNSISAVLRVMQEDRPLVLCSGDLDFVGYSHLADYAPELAPVLEADCLILPHHGGACGTAEQTGVVTSWLVAQTAPRRILVSNGRRKFKNPTDAAVAAARAAAPSGARLVCTQMSTNCIAAPDHLGLPQVSHHLSAGKEGGMSCAGTSELFAGGTLSNEVAHVAMIKAHAPGRLCDW